jgi:hypothetical protein
MLAAAAETLAEKTLTWNPPRHWTLYGLKSAHIDIGLHDSQYKQRHMTVGFIDQARQLADQTSDWPDASRFRYVVEGLWWWLNYPRDRSERAASEIVEKYARQGVFAVGASHSGNHTQVYGFEELCRSAYYAQQARDRWQLPADTMMMVDNNGITWPLVTAYADAGIKNLVFLPNSWNPETVHGSRIDVGWDATLPHLFYWQGPDAKSRMLVWANPHYIETGHDFGIRTCSGRPPLVTEPDAVAPRMARQLALLESRYPYDIWLVSNYDDNEPPNLRFAALAKAWNARWRWPELRTVGDLSEPFREVEKRFGDKIPTLRGDITGGWAQHPLSTPNLLAMKRSADRLLPTAEKLATLVRLADPQYVYPTTAFHRAWDELISNDEHGYGTGHYSGRPVYDTWMQKRDWIERAMDTAEVKNARALPALAASVPVDGPSVIVFNPTLQSHVETVEVRLPESCAHLRCVRSADTAPIATVIEGRTLRFRTSQVPPLGYAVYRLGRGDADVVTRRPCVKPPTVENTFYRVAFAADGSIASILDKQLDRQLVDGAAPYRCNQFVYTRDVHKSFSTPGDARFEIETSALDQTVIARAEHLASGAAIERRVALPLHEKRIDIDNRLDHVRDLASANCCQRFGYYAFPFAVPQGVFRVGLNGCVARPHDDQTGHGTEAYMAARDWTDVGNEQFGVALVQFDSQLVDCGKIHADKKAFGEPLTTSHLYSYIFTDWPYGHAHVTGPSHINLRYRYVIYSHAGSLHEARVARFAERAVTPVFARMIDQTQKGTLPGGSHSFLSIDAPNVSLLTLKLSEAPGRGVIARLHETDGLAVDAATLTTGWGKDLRLMRCSLVEQDRAAMDRPLVGCAPFGYVTIRIESQGAGPAAPKATVGVVSDKSIGLQWIAVPGARQYNVYRGDDADFSPDAYHLAATTRQTRFTEEAFKPGAVRYYRLAAVDDQLRQGPISDSVRATTRANATSPPAKVGMAYTGLISDPRAWLGDKSDMLYFQWGQNRDCDVSHYELFRGETPQFALGPSALVAKVPPGPYVVVPLEDKGLKPHTTYYYRIRAVDHHGRTGQTSDVFSGVTREP